MNLVGWDSASAKEHLTGGFVLVAGTAYYAAVRYLETKVPALSVLLGSTVQPVAYATPLPVTAAVVVAAGDDAIPDDPNAGYDPAAHGNA